MSSNIKIGYHRSHEQFRPSTLVRLAQRAEQEGFTAGLRSDHFHPSVLTDLRRPAQFDTLGQHVQPEELEGKIRISSDVSRHLAWIEEDLQLGFTEVYLHNVNREQEQFIDTFGEKVLPQLGAARP